MRVMSAQEQREIRLEVELPGTPEQVWEAVASGPGISAWFVRAELDGREGGELTLDFGSGMVERSRVTVWEPPSRFGYASSAEGPRALAMEFLVSAREEGGCEVRLVNSGFGGGAEWDGELEAMTRGWRLFLANLALYLTHYRGQPCASIIVNGVAEPPRETALARLAGALGLPAAPALGEPVETDGDDDVPWLAGEVVRVTDEMLTLLLRAPAPGTAFVAAEGDGSQIWTSAYVYLFGADAAAVAARETPRWEAWIAGRFPLPEA
jgi:uncharacterized protein YndB with AHSA1/START domain